MESPTPATTRPTRQCTARPPRDLPTTLTKVGSLYVYQADTRFHRLQIHKRRLWRRLGRIRSRHMGRQRWGLGHCRLGHMVRYILERQELKFKAIEP